MSKVLLCFVILFVKAVPLDVSYLLSIYLLYAVVKVKTSMAGNIQNWRNFCGRVFFWASRENHPMKSRAHSGAEDSVRLLLTKNPARSFCCPWCQVHGISFERFQRPWQTVGLVSGPSHFAYSSLAFFKVVGSSSGVTPSLVRLHSHVWWPDASRKRTSTSREQRKPRILLGLESLPRRQCGETVGRDAEGLTKIFYSNC